MKPIPALIIFIAGLATGTLLTWFAVRPQTAQPGLQERTTATTATATTTTTTTTPNATMRASPQTDLGDVDVDETEEAATLENAAPPPGGVVEVARAEIVDHAAWPKQGFVEMTPPVRLPSDGEARDKIEVWLRIPDGARIRASKRADGSATIAFPPGTIADRVESWGYAKGDDGNWKYSVTDVRGTRLAADGTEMFHVFVPVDWTPGARLVGWEWARGDRLQQSAATTFLTSHLETLRTIQDRGRPQSAEERRALIDSYRRNNNCAKCHQHDKPVETARPRGIHRETDENGFYVPLSVLRDTVPLEKHRPRDMNAGDPFLTFMCHGGGDAPVLAEGAAGARDFRCLQGGSPSATLDVKRALAAHDARTVALCRSRAYLRDHMDEAARALFAKPFADCGL